MFVVVVDMLGPGRPKEKIGVGIMESMWGFFQPILASDWVELLWRRRRGNWGERRGYPMVLSKELGGLSVCKVGEARWKVNQHGDGSTR